MPLRRVHLTQVLLLSAVRVANLVTMASVRPAVHVLNTVTRMSNRAAKSVRVCKSTLWSSPSNNRLVSGQV
jgi:hypothetical protein